MVGRDAVHTMTQEWGLSPDVTHAQVQSLDGETFKRSFLKAPMKKCGRWLHPTAAHEKASWGVGGTQITSGGVSTACPHVTWGPGTA